MNQIKAFVKSFTPYQKWFLGVVLAITVIFVIFFPDYMLEDTSNTLLVAASIVCVLSNPICELMISKQSKLNFVVDIIFVELSELVVCFYNGWYVTAIIICVFWIPVSALSYWRWSRHQDEEKEELTVVKTLTPKQDIAVIAAIFAFAFLAGTLISRIPGASDSYVDALSSGFGIANGVLLLLRYREQWYAWIITLIMDAALYIRGGAYIMLVTVAAMMVNTCYGYWKWYRYNKTHADAV
ncbi:MAG: nicotinamide mononucleotide transporter [Firmicutes bacterium]|nr:nicotinamide mononucleotide transporter [Bacillota bacterium]